MKTKYKHLNCEERILIQLSLEKGSTIRAIALSLDRSASSVSRELARNQWCSPQAQAFRPSRPALAGGYRAILAQQRACVRVKSAVQRRPPKCANCALRWHRPASSDERFEAIPVHKVCSHWPQELPRYREDSRATTTAQMPSREAARRTQVRHQMR